MQEPCFVARYERRDLEEILLSNPILHETVSQWGVVAVCFKLNKIPSVSLHWTKVQLNLILHLHSILAMRILPHTTKPS